MSTHKDKEVEKCKCYCHTQKLVGEDNNGWVHDSLCCKKMNGSLMMWGLEDLLSTQRAKGIKEGYERGYKHGWGDGVESEQSKSDV